MKVCLVYPQNFLALCASGYYDNTKFHRWIILSYIDWIEMSREFSFKEVIPPVRSAFGA